MVAKGTLVLVFVVLISVLLSSDPSVQGFLAFSKLLFECSVGDHPAWCDVGIIPQLGIPFAREYPAKFTATAEDELMKHAGVSGLRGKVAIVTGASRGVGLETARVLIMGGCDVIFAVRSVKKGRKALRRLVDGLGANATGTGVVLEIDLSDLDSVKAFATSFLALNRPLHYLVANAGIMAPPQHRTSAQGYELQFATNHLGHFLLARLLEGVMIESGTEEAPARMVYLSSSANFLWQNLPNSPLPPARRVAAQLPPDPTLPYEPLFNYGFSKALNLRTAWAFQHRFTGKHVVAVALHPGIITTDLLSHGKAGQGSLEDLFFGWIFTPVHKNIGQGASTTIHTLVSPDVPAVVRSRHVMYEHNAPVDLTPEDEVVEAVFKGSEELVAPWL